MISSLFKSAAPLARGLAVAAAAAWVATLVACAASSTTELDKKFGDSVRAIREQQIIAAPALQRQDPVAGLDGVAAVHAQERYQDSFKEPAKTFDMLSSGGTGK